MKFEILNLIRISADPQHSGTAGKHDLSHGHCGIQWVHTASRFNPPGRIRYRPASTGNRQMKKVILFRSGVARLIFPFRSACRDGAGWESSKAKSGMKPILTRLVCSTCFVLQTFLNRFVSSHTPPDKHDSVYQVQVTLNKKIGKIHKNPEYFFSRFSLAKPAIKLQICKFRIRNLFCRFRGLSSVYVDFLLTSPALRLPCSLWMVYSSFISNRRTTKCPVVSQ